MKEPEVKSYKIKRRMAALEEVRKCVEGDYSVREAEVAWREILATYAPDELAFGLTYGTRVGRSAQYRTNQKG